MNAQDIEIAHLILEGKDIDSNVAKLLHCSKEAIVYFLDVIAARVKYNSVRDTREVYEDAGHVIYFLGSTNKDFLIDLFQKEVEKTGDQPYLFTLSWMIGSLQDERVVELLLKALNHPSENVRRNCCNSLRILKSHRAIPVLRVAMMDERFSVRAAATEALAEMGIDIPQNERFVARTTDDDLRRLVQHGDYSEAIARVREKSGWNYEMAKEYVALLTNNDDG